MLVARHFKIRDLERKRLAGTHDVDESHRSQEEEGGARGEHGEPKRETREVSIASRLYTTP